MAVTSFSSYGSISLVNSLVQNTTMETVDSNQFSNSIFISSPLSLGTNPVTIDKVTFFDSPVELGSWIGLPPDNAKITDSNFVGAGTLISLNSVFSLQFSVSISGSYVRIPAGSNFEAMVYDATDDLKVSKDFLASDFLTSPVTNSPNGFKVGTYTLSTSVLLTGVVGNNTAVTSKETHTLSVVVERGVLGADAVLLKGLAEKMTLTDGVVTGHTVTNGTTTFDYAQIDALIMTVTRDGNFTDEFRQEITDAAPSAATLTYNDAVALVGSASIDSVVLRVAGADGLFVA